MKKVFHPNFTAVENQVSTMIEGFSDHQEVLVKGKRNSIKLFPLGEKTVNIKSFKIPNFVNKIVYRYFRKSKANRSFAYAEKLLENGIGTPQPIAYFENYNAIGLADSYYVSEHLQTELTFRELVTFPEYPDHENILRQFTQFSFKLHEKGIEFLDHSPGNTLIKKEANGKYSFYLVDLNRMKFHDTMPFEMRMNNLSHLTPKKEMIEVMANEYAKLSKEPESKVFETLWKLTSDFQYRFQRKKKIKKKLKFWQ